jgi:hypothetical protein
VSFGDRCRSLGILADRFLLLFLFQVLEDLAIVVGRVKLGSECAPGAFFDGDIDFPELFGVGGAA